MYTFTEKLNDTTIIVKTIILDIQYDIGRIEQGYNSNIYMAVDFYNNTLKDGDSCIFTDFNKAQEAISVAFEREFDL